VGLLICPATITREVHVGGGGNGRDGRGATGLVSAFQHLWAYLVDSWHAGNTRAGQ
jgi:hypothetical protein